MTLNIINMERVNTLADQGGIDNVVEYVNGLI